MKIIELEGVSKSYRYQLVLNCFNLFVNKGECVLLIGNNGSGKSTLIKGILGLVSFDSGTVRIRSNKLAYVPEKFYFPEFVTLMEFLKVFLIDFNNQRIYDLLTEWGLKQHANKCLRTFSKGMRQKVLLIQALNSEADIFIFDEPLSGLDSFALCHFLEELEALKQKGKTILIASHNPEKYKKLPDRVIELEGNI